MKTWLQEQNWEIVGNPSEPRRRNAPWFLQGHQKDNPRADSYSYSFEVAGTNRYINVRPWMKQRKINAIPEKLGSSKWWGLSDDPIEHDEDIKVNALPSVSFEAEVATTVEDTPSQMESQDNGLEEFKDDDKKGEKRDVSKNATLISPERKKAKT